MAKRASKKKSVRTSGKGKQRTNKQPAEKRSAPSESAPAQPAETQQANSRAVTAAESDPAKSDAADPFSIVGIGASAGGLAALKAFFQHVPADSDLAYVVVVHLAPEHESHLAELLQPHVKMPVQQVAETIALEKNHVYVIPPNANLDTIDTHLRVTALEKERRERAPIDHFLRTLAKTHDGSAIGVILTGTGSDGTLGLREIKEAGGLCVVQDPAEAEYDGMPQSAVATGIVDLVLPVDEIPAALLRFAKTRPHIPLPESGESVDGDVARLLQKIFAQVRARSGRDFSRYKRSTILRRIQRRMQLSQITELPAYVELLRQQPGEVRTLADDLLITVTNFFRDPPVFETLQQDVIPRLFEGKDETDEIRIWSVGCATGEEAYSLAILLLEHIERLERPPRVQIFASDLHEHSLQKARDGFYPGDIETDVSAERIKRFFVKENGGFRIRKEVRELVVFASHNLLGDPPFSRVDLISCRNVMIYLLREVQREVVELFHYALRQNGFLLLGNSEAVDVTDLFRIEHKKSCLYRKRNVPAPEPRLPVFPMTQAKVPHEIPQLRISDDSRSYGTLHQQIVERYAPPSVLVSPDDRIVHVSQHAGRYLLHPGGDLTASVIRLVRDDLRAELQAALRAARAHGEPVTTQPVEVRFNGESAAVVLHMRPVPDPPQDDFVLIIFDELDARKPPHEDAPESDVPARQAGGEPREEVLARELARTRQRLQAIIEEYETGQEEMRASNEEMQSTNEELRSTMEELETSKEELQSMNEELQTLNQENRHKVEELAQLSSDLQNLMAATDIATLFLDRDLRILRFTPQISELFNVRTTDRGRPLADFTHRLGYPDLLADAQAVLERLIPIERSVQAETGQWFLTRLLPYRSTDDRIDGVVITFGDISAAKRAEQAVQESERRLARELHAMTRLHDLVSALLVSPNVSAALNEVLNATIDITAADMGNVQLLNPEENTLEIVAQRGFGPDFLDHFRVVKYDGTSACGRVMQSRERVVVEDVTTDPGYEPHREAAAAAGFRAVQSTPLISRRGELLGVLSTHYAEPRVPSESELRLLDLYTRQAADFIEMKRSAEALQRLTKSLEEQVERRTWAVSLMQDVAVIANEADSVEDALRMALERVGSRLNWPVGHVFLPRREDPRTFASAGIWYLSEPDRFAEFREATAGMVVRPGEGLAGRVIAAGELRWSRNVLTDPDFIHRGNMARSEIRAALLLPILVRDKVEGVLEFFASDVTEPDDELVNGLAQLGTQLGRVIERQRMKEEIAEASAHENRVIGQELHDTVKQEIVGVGMLAEQLAAELKRTESPGAEIAERIVSLLRETSTHVRQVSHTLMPVEVQPDDLGNALAMLARNTQQLHQVSCRIEGPACVVLESASIASHVYRIAREAVQNAVRHGGANEILLRLTDGDNLLLEVIDNGCGFGNTDKANGMGLRIIRYRANLIGAKVTIESAPGRGTTVACSVPLPR
ncbi:MAG: GAF domain-containing protein [Planctomycetota bacterium]|nr:MAG: GAF domain-containing protein [Planctomycetota bacterium]